MLDSTLNIDLGSGATLELAASMIRDAVRDDDDVLVITLHIGAVLRLGGDDCHKVVTEVEEALARRYQGRDETVDA